MAEVMRHWLNGDDYQHTGGGFMGKSWDSFVPGPAIWRECLRVLKPGGHLLSFFGTRTYDLGVLAIRLAGFEIRDQIAWVYGSGFPKSLDVSKALEARARTGRSDSQVTGDGRSRGSGQHYREFQQGGPSVAEFNPTTDIARQWEGWGTALKPAQEPIVVARKPLAGTVAANVQAHGTGALNIDGCRVPTDENLNGGAYAESGGRSESQSLHGGSGMNQPGKTVGREFEQPTGRWPANVVHDGSEEVLECFPDAGGPSPKTSTVYGAMRREGGAERRQQ